MTDLIYKSEVNSTNEAILDLLHNTPEAFAIYTFNQTKGRGQYGNIWTSQRNQNLAYTIAIKACLIKLDDVRFNYHTATITRDFVANLTKSDVRIKWPNDLIIKQKKISGILIEKKKINNDVYYIVGIGINILQENFNHLPKAGSILTTTAKKMDLQTFAKAFHQYFNNEIISTISEEKVLDDFNFHLFKKDEISVFIKSDTRQNGIIKSADAEGYLWIDFENDGLQKVFHKEVELLF